MTMKKQILSLMAILLFAQIFMKLSAQNQTSSRKLKKVVKTAEPTFSNSQTGRILYIIDKEEILSASVNSLDELLDLVAGVDVRQRGGNGIQADVSIKGGSFDQILILLNGINITDPQTGHYNFDIPLEMMDIDRIEILQGSASRLLGTNAFSGAINIVTGEKKENSIATRNSVGSHHFFSQNINASYQKKNVKTFATLSHKSSDGYKENTDFDITNLFLQTKIKNSLGNSEIQASFQKKQFGANSFYTELFPNQYEDTKTFMASYKWNRQFGNFNNSLQTYWRRHDDRFELFRDFKGAEKFSWYKDHNYHQTNVLGAKWVTSYYWNGHKTSVGLDIRNEHIFSNKLGHKMDKTKKVPFEKEKYFTKKANRMGTTLFLDQVFRVNKWLLAGGVAGYYTKDYGLNALGGLDINYHLTPSTTLFFSTNSAIRIPTFTDLYYANAKIKSNPNLKPEKSLTFEIGTKVKKQNLLINTSIYYRFGFDIIDRLKKENETVWISDNLKQLNALGADFYAKYQFQNKYLKSLNLTYSYLHLNKKAEGFDSRYALDYLNHKIGAGFQHTIWHKVSANWQVVHFVRNGYYENLKKEKVNYKPYTLLNARLMWNSKNISIFGNFNNILAKSYVDYGGVSQPKFNFTVGVELKLSAL